MGTPSLDCLVILVGGVGSRLWPLSWEKPKPLMPLGGVPALNYLLERVRDSGVERVLLACGYASEAFSDWIQLAQPHFPFSLEMHVEPRPLGTGGALSWLKDCLRGRVMLANGDTLLNLDVRAFLEEHLGHRAQASMAITRVEDVSRYGSVQFQGHRLRGFGEKLSTNASGWINAGVYLLEESLWRTLPDRFPFSMERDIFPTWLQQEVPFFVWQTQDYFLDIGTPESYLQAQCLAQAPAEPLSLPGVAVVGPVWLGKGAQVGAGSQLIGPMSLGPGCRVGSNSRLERCVFWDDVEVGADSQLSECILGSKVQLPASTRLARCARLAVWPLAGKELVQEDRVRFF